MRMSKRYVNKSKQHMNKAFTLVELAIVIVVIGLIIGGIVAGQELVSAAKIRSQITQLQNIQTANNTFISKYSYMPGDILCSVAKQYGLYYYNDCENADISGNGNWRIEHNGNGLGQSREALWFWVHLQEAELIPGKYKAANVNLPGQVNTHGMETALANSFPTAKLAGATYLFIWQLSGSHNLTVAGASDFDGLELVLTPNFTAEQAYTIDAKIDDKMALSGQFTAHQGNRVFGSNHEDTTGTYVTGTCSDADGNYNVSTSDAMCVVNFKFME